jgi:enoyl-CoA hydratase
MSEQGRVRYDKAGAVGHILFDRPAARNAMTPAMYAELDAICESIRADTELRAVTLRGAGGRSFVSGSDIAQFLDFTSGEDGIDYERRMENHLQAIATIPVPTIAVIEGWAVGGGLSIAACCDLRIATKGTRFGVPIARTLGNCLSAGSYARVLAGFGEGRARRMLLLGELIETEEALGCGFLTRVVDSEELDATVTEFVEQVLANSPLSMKVSKAALGRLLAPQAVEIEDMIRLAYASEDFHDAVRAFFEKRKPVWKGR